MIRDYNLCKNHWTGTCWRYAHLQLVLNLPMKFPWIPSSGCCEITRTRLVLYYTICSMIRNYNSCKHMLTVCASPIGTESSYEFSLNSKQRLLRNSQDKNCAILYHVQHDQGLQLVQKSLNRKMLTICTSPLGTESFYEVSLNSKQRLLRNSPDRN